MYKDSALISYLDDLAAKKPAPGGGSAAALAGALAAALLSMVANFTISKEKYKQYEAEVSEALRKAESIRTRLTELVDLDIASYSKVRDAFKSQDKQKIQGALKEATAVPLEIAELSCAGIKICPILLEKGNTNLVTDVGVPAHLFKASFDSAALNVEINLKDMEDTRFIAEARKKLTALAKEVYRIEKRVSKKVKLAISHKL